ncbi:MAG TPA: LysR family transcriptional regulator [Burkholderiales bacterium]|nr:LysR family transcriptional regulator [Burkholderiales bacterium]
MDRLHGILVFLRVVEYGSLSAAARALGVSTSAVSTTLTRLERQLAVRLLNRTTRRISVSHEGGEFYARCKQITNDLAEAELVVGQAGRLPSGRLRVRVPRTLGRMWIVPSIRRFTDAHPSIALEVVCTDILPHTIDDGVDVQVQTGELRDSRVAVKRLAAAEYVTCAAPQYLAAHGIPRTVDELLDRTCVAYRRPRTGRLRDWRFKDGVSVRQLPIGGPPIFNNIELLIAAAESGMGVIQVPECYARPSLDSGKLVEVLREYRTSGYHVSAVYLPQQRLAPKIRVFMDFLSALFEPPPWAERTGERSTKRKQGRRGAAR